MPHYKKYILLLMTLLIALLLSACQSKPATQNDPSSDPNQIQTTGQTEAKTYPAEWWETDQYGGQYMTPEGIKKASEQYEKYVEISEKMEAYLSAHPDGKLYAHFSGIWLVNSWDDVVIRLDDIEDPELLRELEAVGIQSDYQLEKWPGSREAGEAAEKQMKEALAALKAKADPNEEEKLLLEKYRPEIGSYDVFSGVIPVELIIDTPWYQQVSGEEMENDLQRAIALFEKYIGKYEFVMYGYPV